MKFLITHIDFNAYFPLRLRHLKKFLEEKGHELYIIEALGNAVLYTFSKDNKIDLNIEYLLPTATYETASVSKINEKLKKRLDAINPDAILAGPITFPTSATAIRWARRNKKGIVIFDNAKKNTFPRGKLTTFIKKIIYKNVDAFLCPSPSFDSSMMYWGFKQEQIFYGLNVTDNTYWAEKPSTYTFTDLPENFFLTVSRQVPFKNLERFVDAYIDYRKQGGIIPLIMVGEGPLHNNLIEKSKKHEGIFLLPFQTSEKIKELFTRTNALFLPSFKTETWGLIVNESMAAGTIVAVSTECGCHDTLVENEKNGFTFNPHDKERMTIIMHNIQNLSPEQKLFMQKNCIDIIKDWDLNRFSNGAYDALMYAYSHKRKKDLFNYLLAKLWKGQFKISNLHVSKV